MWKKRMESALNKYKEKRCECLPLKIVKKVKKKKYCISVYLQQTSR